jgi:hypothetical protein
MALYLKYFSRCQWLINLTKMSHLDDLNLSPNHSRPFVKLFLDSSGCENSPEKITLFTPYNKEGGCG